MFSKDEPSSVWPCVLPREEVPSLVIYNVEVFLVEFLPEGIASILFFLLICKDRAGAWIGHR